MGSPTTLFFRALAFHKHIHTSPETATKKANPHMVEHADNITLGVDMTTGERSQAASRAFNIA